MLLIISAVVLNSVIQILFKSETTLNKNFEKKIEWIIFLRIGKTRTFRGVKFSRIWSKEVKSPKFNLQNN